MADSRPLWTATDAPEGRGAFALRVWLLSAVPLMVIILATVYALWGAVVNMGVTVALFVVASFVRDWDRPRAWPLRWLLARGKAFEDYYREHPPKHPFYYYFFPLMLPFLLRRPEVRAELKLYRAFQGGALLIVLAVAGVEFSQQWAPDLGITAFLPYMGVRLLMEMYLTTALLMPLATTVVMLHRHPSLTRSGVVLVTLVLGLGAGLALQPRLPPSYSARIRVHERAALDHKAAEQTLAEAVSEARAALAREPEPRYTNGNVQGAPLQAARAALTAYWRDDEANTFGVWASDIFDPDLVVVYSRTYGKTPATWLGLRRSGARVTRSGDLPDSAKRWLGLLQKKGRRR